jgi:hypothetical protein
MAMLTVVEVKLPRVQPLGDELELRPLGTRPRPELNLLGGNAGQEWPRQAR